MTSSAGEIDGLRLLIEAGEYEIGEPESDPRRSLVFFHEIPEVMLDHRNAMAEEASFSEWCLVTDRRPGSELSKDYRWLKVLMIVVGDVAAVESSLRRSARG